MKKPSDNRGVVSMEFDEYAKDYSGGMEVGLKKSLGGTFDAFVRVKAKWLMMDLERSPLSQRLQALRLLDFGCGTGSMMEMLRKLGFRGSIEGCDVSEGMLAEAAARWTCGPVPPLHRCEIGRTPFPSNHFDLIVVSCVFHHIAPELRQKVLKEIVRITSPGGRLVVFEHNPHNPITRLIVERTPIDRCAVLLTAREMHDAMRHVGIVGLRTHYLMFFPPVLTSLQRFERFLEWLPLGGQYAVVGSRPL
jgi:ubiquinone/menaquinone biosynthesis C-methylase UbiE